MTTTADERVATVESLTNGFWALGATISNCTNLYEIYTIDRVALFLMLKGRKTDRFRVVAFRLAGRRRVECVRYHYSSGQHTGTIELWKCVPKLSIPSGSYPSVYTLVLVSTGRQAGFSLACSG